MVGKVIFLFAGLFFLIAGILVIRSIHKKYEHDDTWGIHDAEIVSTRVTSAAAKKSRVRRSYSGEVLYAYSYNNTIYKGTITANNASNTHERAHRKIANFKAGQKIQILVNPSDPSKSQAVNVQIDSKFTTYFAGAIFIAIGLIISIAAIKVKI